MTGPPERSGERSGARLIPIRFQNQTDSREKSKTPNLQTPKKLQAKKFRIGLQASGFFGILVL
jgi:hypothetical protein